MQPYERLNKAMNQQRLELGLNWKEVAAGVGIAPETLHAIRRGANRPSDLTARGIERTLQWPKGRVVAILDDADEGVDDDDQAQASDLPDSDEDLKALARQMIAIGQRILGEDADDTEQPHRHAG